MSMPKPLTHAEALRRLMRGQYVPHAHYAKLERAGTFKWRRGHRVLTHIGRLIVRAGSAAVA